MSQRPILTVSIDTEEDDWDSYQAYGASTSNIELLPRLQEIFDRWGARPTYLVNRPPLVHAASVRVLGELAARSSVEIGAHCHPWNTPPTTGRADTMLHTLPADLVHAKVHEVRSRLESELGVRPTTFRSGRWGFGPAVSHALAEEGFSVDASVTPFIDWSAIGGPDYSTAPNQPYRFHPERPFVPDPTGPIVELPTTVGFLRGSPRRAARVRTRLERVLGGKLGVVALLDYTGLLTRRWLSPESVPLRDLIRLATAEVRQGHAVLDMTFHSCALLPGATPFVRNARDQRTFLHRIDRFLGHCAERGFAFHTLGEVGRMVLEPPTESDEPRSAKRALVVSYYFPPAKAVGAQRPARLARLLPDFGYDVDVVCAGVTDIAPAPSSGDFLPDHFQPRRVGERFVWGRDPERPPPREEVLSWVWWKVRAYTESLLLTRDWSWKWAVAALDATSDDLTRVGYDVVIVDAPPRPGVVPFIRWARHRGIPTVLDLRDIWAREDEDLPLWSVLTPEARRARWDLRLRNEAIRSAQHTVLTSPEMAELMAGRVPDVDRSRFTSIPNAYGDVDAHASGSVGSGTESDPFRIVYTGSLAYGRDEQAAALIRAIADLQREEGPTIELAVAGADVDGLARVAREEGVADRLVTHGWLSRELTRELQRGAGALLLLQPEGPIGTRVAIPAKLFEYMARRRTILGLVGGPAARVIREHRLGVVACSDDRAGLAQALLEVVRSVHERPFLPPPPDEFSERTTVADFAAILAGVTADRR